MREKVSCTLWVEGGGFLSFFGTQHDQHVVIISHHRSSVIFLVHGHTFLACASIYSIAYLLVSLSVWLFKVYPSIVVCPQAALVLLYLSIILNHSVLPTSKASGTIEKDIPRSSTHPQ